MNWTSRVTQTLLGLGVGLSGGALSVLLALRTSPLASAAAFGGLAVAMVVMFSPQLGLLLVAAVTPIERLGRFTEDTSMYTISLMRIFGVLALGSFLLHCLLKRWHIIFGAGFFLYGIYLLFCFGSILYTSDYFGSVQNSVTFLGNLLFWFVIVNIARDWRVVRGAVLVWMISSVLIGVYTIYNWHFGQAIELNRIGTAATRLSTVDVDHSEFEVGIASVKRAIGTTSHPAVYGINLLMTVPFFFYLLRTRSSAFAKTVVTIGLAIILYNMFLSNTRAVLILAVLVAVYCALRGLLEVTPGRILAGLLVVLLMLPMLPSSIYTRILDLSNYSYTQSAALRLRIDIWRAGLEVASDNWALGVGVGNELEIPKYLRRAISWKTSVHNEFLETLIEVGVFGWSFFMSFLLLCAWYSFKAAANFKNSPATQEQYWFMVACQTTILGVYIFGLQVDVFHFPLKGWWLVAGLSYVMYRLSLVVPRHDGNAAGHEESRGAPSSPASAP